MSETYYRARPHDSLIRKINRMDCGFVCLANFVVLAENTLDPEGLRPHQKASEIYEKSRKIAAQLGFDPENGLYVGEFIKVSTATLQSYGYNLRGAISLANNRAPWERITVDDLSPPSRFARFALLRCYDRWGGFLHFVLLRDSVIANPDRYDVQVIDPELPGLSTQISVERKFRGDNGFEDHKVLFDKGDFPKIKKIKIIQIVDITLASPD